MMIFIDKKALCSTPLKDFCEIQGIGNDPMYMRPGSVQSIVGRYIPKDIQNILQRMMLSFGLLLIGQILHGASKTFMGKKRKNTTEYTAIR